MEGNIEKRLGGGRDVEGKAGWNCPRAPSFYWGEKENDRRTKEQEKACLMAF